MEHAYSHLNPDARRRAVALECAARLRPCLRDSQPVVDLAAAVLAWAGAEGDVELRLTAALIASTHQRTGLIRALTTFLDLCQRNAEFLSGPATAEPAPTPAPRKLRRASEPPEAA